MRSATILLVLLLASLAAPGCQDDAPAQGSGTSDATDDAPDADEPDAPGRPDVVSEQDAENPGEPDSDDMADADLPDADEEPDADTQDAEEPDADTQDAEAPDAEEADADEPDVQEAPTVVFTHPLDGAVFPQGTSMAFEVMVEDARHPAEALTVRWSSSLEGELGTSAPGAQGFASLTTDALGPGTHLITAHVSNPEGLEARASIQVGICVVPAPETFDMDLDPTRWRIYGDAFWDPRGWLEMTDNLRDRAGAIFNIEQLVAPGDVSLRFRILTGGGSGADGFAMSIFDVSSVEELDALMATARNGGGLGFGVGGAYGPWVGDAFHVEFDTWHNVFNGNTELHTDPTPENHVAVLRNGDAGAHELWAPIPNIEDQQWHDVEIVIQGFNVTVRLDGAAIIEGEVSGLDFKGGYIGFSGSTGFFTNFHRIDDLALQGRCEVP